MIGTSHERDLMEFLVNIQIEWPADISADAKEEISRREREEAARHASNGNLRRMWRVPGRTENWGLWEAEDATQLHSILSSLPVFPWMDITVHPLARHPVDPHTEEPVTATRESDDVWH